VALVSPIEDFQVKRLRLPRVIAIIVTLLVVLSVIALVSLFVAQAIRTIAYTAADYSTSFANMAEKLLRPLEYVYRLPESPPLVVAETPKPPLTAAVPNDLGPVISKPEVVELFPVVKDADRPGLLDVRPRPSPPTPPRDGAFDNSVLLAPGPSPSPPALTKGGDQAVAPQATPPASGPPSESARPAPPAAVQAANTVADANAEASGATQNQWHLDTRQIVEELLANARQIVRDMANHMFNMLRNTVGTIFGLLSGVLLVCVFVIFLLAGRNPRAEHSQMYIDVVGKIRRYLGTKVITSALVGVLVWASLAIIGMELAGVFGILAFLVNFIPVIGPIIVTVLPIPIALAQFHSPWPVILVVVIPGGIHNIIGNIIEPKLMGEGLDLHPVTILLAVSFWGLLWGIVGMFLATPITAVVRIVLMQFDTFRPIANLLAGDFSKPQAATSAAATAASALPEGTVPDGSLPG
jgi:AI-2 transport protein TqsA